MSNPNQAGELTLTGGETGHDFTTPRSGSEKHHSRLIKGLGEPVAKPPNVEGNGVWAILNHPLSLLLFCLPVAVVAWYLKWSELSQFWLLFCALIPLAKILGDATEELAAGLKNDMLAGLLNATFGNAVEMVITVQTLRAGLFDVVKATLMGSVLSNMLLVLGCSFFFGGIVAVGKEKATKKVAASRVSTAVTLAGFDPAVLAASLEDEIDEEVYGFVGEKVQHFQILSALVNTSMLLLSCLSFCLVAVFSQIPSAEGISVKSDTVLPVSRICSIIIAMAYVAYIIFQLVTHREAMAEERSGDGEEEDAPVLGVWQAVVMLFVTTCVVAVASEMLVCTIEEVTEQAHMSRHFIGIILLPIIGNACEHVSAVRFAMKDKPGLSIGITIGSSTQISLFVVPFSVVAGWMLDREMDMDFGPLNTTVMTLSVITVLSVVVDGQSNWLQGYLLCSAYLVIAVLYWFLPNELPNEI